ncbi:zinc-binding dehydrogenase [Mucilaginibacter robiniae]|uniref:Zinc-binding dehydrogenase n=1 Tax=Mucilaginibacter robiniae TaxID=2728022 RepID=A0A7L5E7J4_9SPHI|nr:zinc-binding dehydrogenase [Mucilaginibacter robiniae]QJD96833.1 zinc-binding dehydrogenase [Mucilaginibacter robiniae]
MESAIDEKIPTPSPASVMDAMEITAPKTVTVKQVPLPEPAPDEVRIKMEGCGLCASNLPMWEGREWFTYPVEAGKPGHEGWGRIDAVGKDVTGFAKGDRVAAITFNAFAEYDITQASNLIKLPSELDGIPFPGEPLGCAMNIFNRSDIQAGQTVAIIGIGFLGAMLVQLAHQAGAKVIALTRKHSAIELAQQLGADEIIPLDDHWQIIEKVKQLTNGNFCERVIEATGKQWPLDLAAELTAIRGKLIIAGYHQDGLRQVNMQLWNWRGLDVINAHERDPKEYLKGMRNAVEAVQEGRLSPERLFTHIFPAKDLQKAFEIHDQNPEGFMKALITFND